MVKGSRVEVTARGDQDCETTATITQVVSQALGAALAQDGRPIRRLHKPVKPVDMSSASPVLSHRKQSSYHPEMLKTIIHFLGSAALLVILLTPAPHAWAQASAGSISALSGSVTVERVGKSIPAAYGAALQVGDKLTTGPNGRITIRLSDGSQLELNDSSTLVLTENILNPDGSRASTKVTLLGGLVRSLVKIGPGSPPNFEVHTPNAVASARGTMFDVSYHEGQTPPVAP